MHSKSKSAARKKGFEAGDSQMPLQQELERETRDRQARLLNKRLRPRVVKFNANLLTPVLQRGLERWTADFTWKSERLMSHSMPLDDSLLGGENTFMQYVSDRQRENQNKIIKDCLAVRNEAVVTSDTRKKIVKKNPYRLTQLKDSLPDEAEEGAALLDKSGVPKIMMLAK